MKPLRKPKKLTAKQRALNESWNAILNKYDTKVQFVPQTPSQQNFYRRETPYVPSLNSAVVDNCAKKEIAVYTGTNMIGIVVQHKSCLQPVFNQESLRDSAKMRR